ncbi:MAG: sugar ABC transporter permease [Oscillospiraceae bacterium]
MAFLTPSVLGVAVFFILPFFVIVYYSLINNPIQHEFVFLDNFIALFNNSSFKTAALNTAKFSAIAVPLAVVLAFLLAQMLESRIPLKSQFRTFFLSPMMVPVASVVLIWQVIFSYNGTLNDFIANFGVDKIDWLKSQYSQVVIIILFLWKNLGYNMILFMAALNNIPKELMEVADIEGASPFCKFKNITLRYLSPTILFVTILSLINSFKVFREIFLLTGEYPFEGLYMLQHFMNNTFKALDYQKLSAAAVLMALVMVVIIALLFVFEDKLGKDVEG